MNITDVKMNIADSNSNGSSASNNGAQSAAGNNGNGKQQAVNNRCNLIVNYLPQSLKEHDFNMLFSKIGPLKTCKLMFDRQTGYSFGYGFVEYVNEEDAQKAIASLNGYQLEHKRLKVALARPNCEETKNTNLYIRNIPISYDEQQLHDLFSQYGDVVQVRLLRDQNTTFSRRIGFVIMATKQMAQLAIQHLDNTVPPNAAAATEPIYVKYADEEGKKRHGPPNNANGAPNQRGGGPHHQNNFPNNNYLSQQQNAGFNFNNSFMMSSNGQQQPNSLTTLNTLQNLGKMKTNRSSGHQNRYNPIGGAALNNGGLNPAATNGGGAAGSNYNPWNMNMNMAAAAAAVLQQPYSNFGATPNNTALVGNSGFDNLINTIGTGGSSGNGTGAGAGTYNSHHHQQHHGHPAQMQQQHFNNTNNSYINLNSAQAAAAAMAAAAAAAAAGLGTSSSTGNLLDVSTGGSLPMDAKTSNGGNGTNGASTGHIIYVYGIGQANESDLYSLFSHCGRISRVNVIKNQKTGQCKGYGFVVFDTYEEAYYAVHNMNGYMYNHRPLQVQLNAGHIDS